MERHRSNKQSGTDFSFLFKTDLSCGINMVSIILRENSWLKHAKTLKSFEETK